MALTVRDIPALPGLDSLRLLSGSGGLDRKVVTWNFGTAPIL